MQSLVDYQSGSGSDSEQDEQSLSSVSKLESVVPSSSKHLINDDFLGIGNDDDVFFSNGSKNQEARSFLNLPCASRVEERTQDAEDALEDIVKQKDWEKKILEKKKKIHRKKESKARFTAKQLESESVKSAVKSTTRKKIAAFGALASIQDDSDDEETKFVPDRGGSSTSVHNHRSTNSGLLSMLPAPASSKEQPKSFTTTFLPVSVKKPAKVIVTPTASILKEKRRDVANSDDSDGDGESVDFFGLSSSNEPSAKVSRLDDEVPMFSNSGLVATVGPSRPLIQDYIHPSQMYNYADSDPSIILNQSGDITNEGAHQLLLQHDADNRGGRSINELAMNIVDARVDDKLGDDIQATLLRTLHKRSMAKSSMAPLPKVANVRDQTAKRKHQIGYLAQMAVAREEAIQEQAAESRALRLAGREKYGF